MKLSEIGEQSLLEILRKRFKRRKRGLVLGIGDDAAVVRNDSTYILLTTDMMVEGIHFDLRWMTPFQLGFKLMSVNVSDIYAMGGVPHYVLLNIAAHRDTDMQLIAELMDGIEYAVEQYGITLIGGDTAASPALMVSAMITGKASKVITRKGARAGDKIYVTGPLGDSAGGLELLKKIGRPLDLHKRNSVSIPLRWRVVSPLLERHLMPSVKGQGGVIKKINAMIDISDGLLIDLSRICTESKRGAVIYEERIPLSAELREAADFLGIPALSLALEGGEDYELLFTAPRDKKINASCIGEIIGSGMFLVDRAGNTRKISGKGYRHFEV